MLNRNNQINRESHLIIVYNFIIVIRSQMSGTNNSLKTKLMQDDIDTPMPSKFELPMH
jgi:hypothetical protein